MPDSSIQIRAARDDDRFPLAHLLAAVAEERAGIATEPPVDIEMRAASWTLDGLFVAVAGSEIVGTLHVERRQHGVGEVAMMVAQKWGAAEWALRSSRLQSNGRATMACTS